LTVGDVIHVAIERSFATLADFYFSFSHIEKYSQGDFKSPCELIGFIA
jgi:hypothetical protein